MPNVVFVHPDVRKLLPSYETFAIALTAKRKSSSVERKYLPMPNPDDQSPKTSRDTTRISRAPYSITSRKTRKPDLSDKSSCANRRSRFRRRLIRLSPTRPEPACRWIRKRNARPAMLWALAAPGCTSTIPATNIADTSTQNGQGNVEGVENAVRFADIESGEVRPTLRVIPPWDIINHRVKRRGAKIVLSLVVFREDAIIDDDGFETRKMDQWRVFVWTKTDCT
jgi:hypothetical protein